MQSNNLLSLILPDMHMHRHILLCHIAANENRIFNLNQNSSYCSIAIAVAEELPRAIAFDVDLNACVHCNKRDNETDFKHILVLTTSEKSTPTTLLQLHYKWTLVFKSMTPYYQFRLRMNAAVPNHW